MRKVLRRVFWRSFFLETLWNYQKRQNIGFLFCIYPVLEILYPEEKERRQALERHLGQVNTHPAMGPLLVGYTARLEREGQPSRAIADRKRVMSASLAALGDPLFWGYARPLAAVVGVALSLWFRDSVVGVVALLILYNVPHLFVRFTGFSAGWNDARAALRAFASSRVQTSIKYVRRSICLFLGFTAGMLLMEASLVGAAPGPGRTGQIVAASLAALVAAAFILMKWRVRMSMLVYPVSVATIALYALLN